MGRQEFIFYMANRLTRNGWLLALAGALEAVYAVLMVAALDQEGLLTLRTGISRTTILSLGKLVIAAGICTVAAGMWRTTKGRGWWLALNGFGLCSLGAIEWIVAHWSLRMSFRPFTALFVLIAVTLGVFAFRESAKMAGAISMIFALVFLVLTLGAINLRQHAPEFLNICMSAYFAFSAIFLLTFTWRAQGPRHAIDSLLGSGSPHPA